MGSNIILFAEGEWGVILYYLPGERGGSNIIFHAEGEWGVILYYLPRGSGE